MIVRAHGGAFFAQRAAPGDAARLLELCWKRHPSGPDVWWTKSPLLAAPLWGSIDAQDRETREALGPWAWNYQTSFAEGPVAGGGNVRVPEGRALYPFQVGGVQRALMRPKMLICDQPGLGKQQPIDSLVLTPMGWRTIGSIKTGDYAIGSNGRATRVQGVFPQGIKPSYRVGFGDGSSVEAGLEHLWTVIYWHGSGHKARLVLTTRQLLERPVVERLNLAKTDLYVPMLSAPVEFAPIGVDQKLDPYLMGQLISNGSLLGSHVLLTINANDQNEIVPRIGTRISTRKTYGGAHRIGLPGLLFLVRELDLNVHSRVKFIPDVYKFARVDERINLLHGLMDGDGSISKERNKVTYHSTSKQLAHDVRELVEGLGGIASVRSYDRSQEEKPIEYHVRIRLPPEIPPFSITRKLSRYKPGRQTHPTRLITSVEYVRETQSVCIAVDAEDELYVTEHCILTHNTPQALAVLNCVRPARTLIGCPTFLATNWAEECERWCVDAQPVAVLDGAKKTIPERGIVILPYSRGHTFEKQLLAGPPCDLVICDEFHNLKDPNARRSGPWFRAGGLVERARRALLLSGTPMPNNPVELHAPLRAAAPELLGGMTREKFQETYCSTLRLEVGIETRSGRTIKKEIEKIVGKSKEALNAELRAGGVLVRRLKDAVLPQLPPKNLYFVHMRPDAEIEQLVREEADLFEQLQTRILPSAEMMALRGHVASVRRRLGALKAPKIAEYVRSLFDGGEDRVVLFMLHLEAIEIVRRAFERSGIIVHVLTGAEAPTERFARVRDFQAPGGRKLVVGQVTAAGEGLTMTASRFAVLGEISWTPGKNEQAVDRVHRITQTRHVDCPVLTFPHAIEARCIRVNARKALDARAVLDVDLMEGVG